MKYLKNQRGFSIVEVLITAAIVAGISLVVTKISNESNRNMKKLETDAELLDFDGYIKSRLRNSDVCLASLENENFTTGTSPSAGDPPPPSDSTNTTPYNNISTLVIRKSDGTAERSLVVTASGAANDRMEGFPNWSLREIRIYNQVGGTGGIGGRCSLMFRMQRFGGGDTARKRTSGVLERITWLDLNCNLGERSPPGDTTIVLKYCSERALAVNSLWQQIDIGNPEVGIRYDRGLLVDIRSDLSVSGSIEVDDQTITPSDKRYKKQIKKLINVKDTFDRVRNISDTLSKVNVYSYVYRREDFPERNFSRSLKFGFIAQEVKKYFPNTVVSNRDDMYSVNYVMFVPLLLRAHQEQQIKIDKLESKLEVLEEKLNSITNRLK